MVVCTKSKCQFDIPNEGRKTEDSVKRTEAETRVFVVFVEVSDE